MKKRLFLGIPIPDTIKNKLTEIQQSLTTGDLPPSRQGKPPIRFVSKDNHHITISFLGSTEEEYIPKISDSLNRLIKNMSPFSLVFKDITFAPPDKTPRMIWAEFEKNSHFEDLVSSVDSSLRKYSQTDYRAGLKPIPHITLARFKNIDDIKKKKFKKQQIPDLVVSEFSLYESRLSPNGPSYLSIQRFSLNT